MNLIKNILIIMFLFSIVRMECNDLEFFEIQDEQNRFLKREIDISKKPFKTDEVEQYSEKVAIMKSYLDEIACCIDCSKGQKDELRYQLHYQFAKSTMLRYGKMVDYKTSLDKSIRLLDNLIDNLDEKKIKKYKKQCSDEDEWTPECHFISDIYQDARAYKRVLNRFNNHRTDYINEQNILLNQYKDIDVFIKGKFFDEMLEIMDERTNSPIIISLDVPMIFYNKKFKNKFVDKNLEGVTDSTKKLFKTQFDRIENLTELSERFRLTSYNEKKGFHFKIPMVPIIQERIKSSPDYSYAIVINSGSEVTKYRFELTTKSEKKKTFKGLELNPSDYNWNFTKKEIPHDWTKVELDDKLSWRYLDSEDTEICSFMSNDKTPLNMNLSYKETFIAIHNQKDDKIIIYQKDTGDIDGYRLEFVKDKKGQVKEKIIKSLKFLIFLLLFGMGYAESV